MENIISEFRDFLKSRTDANGRLTETPEDVNNFQLKLIPHLESVGWIFG
jgi:hypothetical protein